MGDGVDSRCGLCSGGHGVSDRLVSAAGFVKVVATCAMDYDGRGLTAGVTGKGGIWRAKPPDAESAVGNVFSESVGESPHLSGARGVTHLPI